jgi:hypothetical protein
MAVFLELFHWLYWGDLVVFEPVEEHIFVISLLLNLFLLLHKQSVLLLLCAFLAPFSIRIIPTRKQLICIITRQTPVRRYILQQKALFREPFLPHLKLFPLSSLYLLFFLLDHLSLMYYHIFALDFSRPFDAGIDQVLPELSQRAWDFDSREKSVWLSPDKLVWPTVLKYNCLSYV